MITAAPPVSTTMPTTKFVHGSVASTVATDVRMLYEKFENDDAAHTRSSGWSSSTTKAIGRTMPSASA